MITVGLDFGTHQTKVCVENKDGVELNYTFVKFEDAYNRHFFTLPSIVGVGKDDLLSYGYLPEDYKGRVIRYFKQSTFRPSSTGMSQIEAIYFSIWYIAYILFDLEEMYGKTFSIQTGAPTDSSHINEMKMIATRVIASAYRLVEDVFDNNKHKFLATPMKELKELTEIVPYSQDTKYDYGIYVFPEAYACLKPLVSQGKLASCVLCLMIDIGGGTTDISFFNIDVNDKMPQVYDFFSINKGLNFLTGENKIPKGATVNVRNASEIDPARMRIFFDEINGVYGKLKSALMSEFCKQTGRVLRELYDALENRPLVYCGGGSTFNILRKSYGGFNDIRLVSQKEWNIKCVQDVEEIINNNLCPILSTAYGLAISTEDDNINMKPFRDLFEKMRENFKKKSASSTFGSAYGGFSYGDDWDAWK